MVVAAAGGLDFAVAAAAGALGLAVAAADLACQLSQPLARGAQVAGMGGLHLGGGGLAAAAATVARLAVDAVAAFPRSRPGAGLARAPIPRLSLGAGGAGDRRLAATGDAGSFAELAEDLRLRLRAWVAAADAVTPAGPAGLRSAALAGGTGGLPAPLAIIARSFRNRAAAERERQGKKKQGAHHQEYILHGQKS